jgi:prepilin peptidase CpaA
MKDFFPIPPLPPRGEIIVLLIVVLVAAGYDLRYRRIPNWLTASGVLAGLAMNTFLLQGWQGVKLSLIGLAVGFGVYFVLYALRAMGAGDVKLMAAVGTVVGPSYWFRIFLITAMLGGVLAILFSLLKKRLGSTFWNVGFILSEMARGRPAYLGKEELDVRSEKALRMAHGAIIALGTIVYLGLAAYYSD